jgi:hypothetical protein
MHQGGPSPREGNLALSALLLVHGLVMNGGVFHAVEAVSDEELRSACAGFRYFGFSDAADLLEAASREQWTDESEVRFNTAYGNLVDDEPIGRSFQEHFARNPAKYAP